MDQLVDSHEKKLAEIEKSQSNFKITKIKPIDVLHRKSNSFDEPYVSFFKRFRSFNKDISHKRSKSKIRK